MDKFCVIYNIDKEKACKCSVEIAKYLKERGRECVIAEHDVSKKRAGIGYTDANVIPDDTDCIIVLGGDGTLIQAAHDTVAKDIPIYGINLGGVGYLTESEPESMWEDIDDLINNKYRIEKRMMLDGIVYSGDKEKLYIALNDFVVNKHDIGNVIGFEVYVNNALLGSFYADGVIVSTPTGTTGYNLSAGGPILSPKIESICVTPICPHSLNNRSFVISGDDTVMIKLTEGKNSDIDSAIVVSDGRSVADIVTGERVFIKKSRYYTEIVLKEDTNFYKRVSRKLN